METPALVPSPGVDRHIEAFAVGEGPLGYLATSPEYHMKRLLAAGAGAIYQLTRAYRQEERGHLHNPEFTILEWYRPGWEYPQLMDEVELLLTALAAAGGPGGILAAGPYERLTVRQAFLRTAGVDPHRATVANLRGAAASAGTPPGLADEDRDGWLAYLQAAVVEPGLGTERPVFLHLYPADQCALARIRPGDPPLAERFELYAGGIELANGFTELTDSAEQRRRVRAENAVRASEGRPTFPEDEEFLAALDSMPPSAGVALGVDRIVMILLGLACIDDCMAFAGALG